MLFQTVRLQLIPFLTFQADINSRQMNMRVSRLRICRLLPPLFLNPLNMQCRLITRPLFPAALLPAAGGRLLIQLMPCAPPINTIYRNAF